MILAAALRLWLRKGGRREGTGTRLAAALGSTRLSKRKIRDFFTSNPVCDNLRGVASGGGEEWTGAAKYLCSLDRGERGKGAVVHLLTQNIVLLHASEEREGGEWKGSAGTCPVCPASYYWGKMKEKEGMMYGMVRKRLTRKGGGEKKGRGWGPFNRAAPKVC